MFAFDPKQTLAIEAPKKGHSSTKALLLNRMKKPTSGIPQLAALVLAAVIVTFWLQTHRPIGTDVRNNPQMREIRADSSSPISENPRADVTLVVFTDYRCPVCRRDYPAMKRALSRDGRVRVVYKDWPVFGPVSERAAAVAIASDFQGIYPQVHDRLMTGPVRDQADLRSAVEKSGGDWRRLQRDLKQRKDGIAAQLRRNHLQAFALGLAGTPGYLIGRTLVRGGLSEGEFSRAFRQARKAN